MTLVNFESDYIVELPSFEICNDPVPGTWVIKTNGGYVKIYPESEVVSATIAAIDNNGKIVYKVCFKRSRIINFFHKNDYSIKIKNAIKHAMELLEER